MRYNQEKKKKKLVCKLETFSYELSPKKKKGLELDAQRSRMNYASQKCLIWRKISKVSFGICKSLR